MRGAYEVARGASLRSLSMPVLAEHLDVGVTSIYWYFRKKAHLLNAMTDVAAQIYAEALIPVSEDRPWQDMLRRHFTNQHEVLVRDPVVTDLVMMRRSTSGLESDRRILAVVEAVVKVLIEQGFAPDDALRVYNAMSIYTRGVVIHSRGRTGNDDDELAFGLSRLMCGFEALLAERP